MMTSTIRTKVKVTKHLHFFGNDLYYSCRELRNSRHHRLIIKLRNITANTEEGIESFVNVLQECLQCSSQLQSSMLLKQLKSDITNKELELCHIEICPDLEL